MTSNWQYAAVYLQHHNEVNEQTQWQWCCSKMQSGNLEAWTSTVEADYFQNGQVISKRMDILLGSSLGSCKGDILLLLTASDAHRLPSEVL